MKTTRSSRLLLIAAVLIMIAPSILLAATVQLSWQPNSEPDLHSYNVYYGTQPRTYGPPVPADKNASYTISGLDEGAVYYFAVTAVDNNGNESGFSKEISKITPYPNNEPPVIAISSPSTSGSFTASSESIDIAGTASSNQGIQQVTWRNSNASTGIATGTDNWTITGLQLAEGQNVIAVTATDAAGNQAEDQLTVTYYAPDIQAPAVTITAPTAPSGGVYQTSQASVQIAGKATDDRNINQVTWSLGSASGTAAGTVDWSTPAIALAEGLNAITITAVDDAGNQGAATIDVNYVTPDNTAPVVDITIPTAAGTFTTNSRQISLGGTAGDDRDLQKVTWISSTGSGGTATGTQNWSIPDIDLTAGVNTITVTATDGAGNQSSTYLSVNFMAADTEDPTVEITSPTTRSRFFARTDRIDIDGKANDNSAVAKVTWRNSRGESGTCSGTADWYAQGIQLQRWWNTITITAFDEAGNSTQKVLRIFRWR